METYRPDEELRSRVKDIVILRSESGMLNTLDPNPAAVLAFRLNGLTTEQFPHEERPVPRMALTGVTPSLRVIRYHRRAAMLLVRFHPGGAAGLVPAPMDQLTGTSQSLDSLIDPTTAHEIEAQMDEASDDAGRVLLVQRFLKQRLKDHTVDPLIRETVRAIRQARGNLKVKELVRDLATNPDTLEKKFRALVGTTPKLFAQLMRFQSFVDGYSPQVSLTETALRAGFYDQAHLIKEFQRFTGNTPTAFFRRPRRW